MPSSGHNLRMSIEKYIRHPAGQRDPLVQYRLRIRTKVLGADGEMKPYIVDERHPTRAAALEAEERHWAYIRGDQIKADIIAKIARSTEPNIENLLHRYCTLYTKKKAESGQKTEVARLEKTIPETMLEFGSLPPDPALFRDMKMVELLGLHYVSFGSLRISACDKTMLKKYILAREKRGRKPETIRRELVLISCAFDRANDIYKRNVENPVAQLKDDEKPAPGEHRERVLTPTEEKKLLAEADKAKNPETALAFRLALGTAMRKGDIYGLLWERIDWDARTINLGTAHKSARAAKTKGRRPKPRRVLLLPTAFEALQKHWQAVEKPTSGRVFSSFTPDGFKTAMRRVLEKSEIEDFHFHDLRHTVLTRLAAAGWSPIQVAKTQNITDAAHLERRAYEDEKAAKALQAAESGKALETKDLMTVAGHNTAGMVGGYANLKPEDAPQPKANHTKIRLRKEGGKFVATMGDFEAEGDTVAEAKELLISLL
jgi:integrase